MCTSFWIGSVIGREIQSLDAPLPWQAGLAPTAGRGQKLCPSRNPSDRVTEWVIVVSSPCALRRLAVGAIVQERRRNRGSVAPRAVVAKGCEGADGGGTARESPQIPEAPRA